MSVYLTLRRTLSLLCGIAGLSSDLCTSFGKTLLPLLSNAPAIHELLKEGRRSRIKRTKTLATWAAKELKNVESWYVDFCEKSVCSKPQMMDLASLVHVPGLMLKI